jgi:hypothetical protein
MTEPFDVSRFRADPGLLPPDPFVGAVPVDGPPCPSRQSAARNLDQFAHVPMAAWRLFPPQARILLLLQRLTTVFPADETGGWYRLSTSRLADAGLDDRYQRRRALAQLERDGVVELDRRNGKKTILARFAPHAGGLLRRVGAADWKRRSSVPKLQITDADTGVITELDIGLLPVPRTP